MQVAAGVKGVCNIDVAHPTISSSIASDQMPSPSSVQNGSGTKTLARRQDACLAEQMDTMRFKPGPRNMWPHSRGLNDLHYPYIPLPRGGPLRK
jgi:hypothetical protein